MDNSCNEIFNIDIDFFSSDMLNDMIELIVYMNQQIPCTISDLKTICRSGECRISNSKIQKYISNLENLIESICKIGRQFCIEELVLVYGTTLSSPLKSFIFNLQSKICDEEDKQETKKRKFLRELVTSGILNTNELRLCKMFTVLKVRTQSDELEFPEHFCVIENFELNEKKMKPIVVNINNKSKTKEDLEKEVKYVWIKSKIPLEGIKF